MLDVPNKYVNDEEIATATVLRNVLNDRVGIFDEDD